MSIHIILGPMFSGKTTELLRQGRRAQLAGKNVLYVKHALDCKRRVNEAGEEALVAENLHQLWNALISPTVHIICIDEGQFFTDIRPMCTFLMNVHKKHIIVAALNATYANEMFQPVIELIPFANSVQWLTSICFRCGSDQATYTHRLSTAIAQNVCHKIIFFSCHL
jgi:thymidine kinase